MSSGKRVLGRGLADLIPVGGGEGSSGAGSGAAAAAGATLGVAPGSPNGPQERHVKYIHPNPNQPRTRFDDDSLAELAESIKRNGILQPILLRPRKAGGWEIVAGERRFRAALRVGLTTVPAIVRELSDAETLAVALIENLIREDISPIESARAFQRLMDDFDWTQEELGKRVGKSRPAIANTLRLLDLPKEVQDSLERGEIAEGHARALLGDRSQRSDPEFARRQTAVVQQIVSRGLSVREVERMMRPDASPGAEPGAAAAPRAPSPAAGGSENVSRETFPAPRSLAPGGGSAAPAAAPSSAAAVAGVELRALEDRLRDALGTQVRIAGSFARGRIEIEYFSGDELDGLLTRLESAFAPKAERIGGAPSGNGSSSGMGGASAIPATVPRDRKESVPTPLQAGELENEDAGEQEAY